MRYVIEKMSHTKAVWKVWTVVHVHPAASGGSLVHSSGRNKAQKQCNPLQGGRSHIRLVERQPVGHAENCHAPFASHQSRWWSCLFISRFDTRFCTTVCSNCRLWIGFLNCLMIPIVCMFSSVILIAGFEVVLYA